MKDHTANIRRQLGELAELSAKTDAAERRILEAAESQLERINARLEEIRPKANLDDEAGQEYQKLVHYRARVQLVISQAHKNLAG